jgi:hypothetical protein
MAVFDFEQLVGYMEKVDSRYQPDGIREGIYNVLVIYKNGKSTFYPELKQDVCPKGCKNFGFGRNHYTPLNAKKGLCFDGEDVNVSFNKNEVKKIVVSKSQIRSQLSNREIFVSLNNRAPTQNLKALIENK